MKRLIRPLPRVLRVLPLRCLSLPAEATSSVSPNSNKTPNLTAADPMSEQKQVNTEEVFDLDPRWQVPTLWRDSGGPPLPHLPADASTEKLVLPLSVPPDLCADLAKHLSSLIFFTVGDITGKKRRRDSCSLVCQSRSACWKVALFAVCSAASSMSPELGEVPPARGRPTRGTPC